MRSPCQKEVSDAGILKSGPIPNPLQMKPIRTIPKVLGCSPHLGHPALSADGDALRLRRTALTNQNGKGQA